MLKQTDSEVSYSLKPGFRVSHQRVESAPFVHMTLTVRNGLALEKEGEYGFFSLMSSLLSRGCGALNRKDFAFDCDRRGADINHYPGRDFLTLECWVLPRDLRWALQTLHNMLWEPKLEEAEILIASREQQLHLKAREDEKRSRLFDTAKVALYSEEHHYSRSLLGVGNCLEAVNPESLRAFHKRLVNQSEFILCVTGGFESQSLESLVEQLFSNKVCSAQKGFPEPLSFRHQACDSVRVEFPVEQAEVLVALPSLSRWDPDYRLALFCNEILGGSFLSRLTRVVRSQEGLAYSAASRLRAGLHSGLLWLSLQTDCQNVPRALEAARGCLDGLARHGIDEEEFKSLSMRFSRGANVKTEVGSGGLGLAICSYLLEQMASKLNYVRKNKKSIL